MDKYQVASYFGTKKYGKKLKGFGLKRFSRSEKGGNGTNTRGLIIEVIFHIDCNMSGIGR